MRNRIFTILDNYSLAIDGDSVVIATERTTSKPSEDNPEVNKLVSKVRLMSVSANDSISYIETNRDGNTIIKMPTLAFDIPTVDETTSVFAFAKVKKKNLLRSATGVKEEVVDVKQAKQTYASIQLFPVATNTGAGYRAPVKVKKAEVLQIYVRDDCAVVVGQLKETIKVYTVAGVLLKSVEPNKLENETAIPLPKGVYIITSGGKTGKVII